MTQQYKPTLVVLPALAVFRNAAGRVLVPRKFVTGLTEYARFWPGPVTALVEESSVPGDSLDQQEFDPDHEAVSVRPVAYSRLELSLREIPRAVVLAAVNGRQNQVSAVCRRLDIPCCYVTEYTLRTRLQIIAASRPVALKIRFAAAELLQEWRQRRAIALAAGVQCNGTPTYEAYKTLSRNPLLFFDSRMRQELLGTEAEMERRTRRILAGSPLRLVFSGRLVPMKGVEQLIPVALALRDRGVAFEMTICGDGESKASLQRRIQRCGLERSVKLAGILEFQQELVPFVREQADVFVCVHPQGDPSCTYLETMGCGVPIAGYANEAWRGMHRLCAGGWLAPLNDPGALARVLIGLDRQRADIVAAALRARAFAAAHTFEQTFAARIAHLRELSAV